MENKEGFLNYFYCYFLRKPKLETKGKKTPEPILVEIVGQDTCFSL